MMSLIINFAIGLKEEQQIQMQSCIGWIIIALNLLMIIHSSYFFLFKMKVGIIGWLMLNTCAITVMGFIVGYIFSSPILLVTFAVIMFRYGTLGLFFFSWSGTNLFAQAGHIMMTAGVMYTCFYIIRERTIRSIISGIVLGIILCLAFWYGFQHPWYSNHPGALEALFQGHIVLSN